MARSKKSITPPIRKKPPIQQSVRCYGTTNYPSFTGRCRIVPPEQKATPISVAGKPPGQPFMVHFLQPPAKSRAVHACDASRGKQAALGKLYDSILWESESHMEGILNVLEDDKRLGQEGGIVWLFGFQKKKRSARVGRISSIAHAFSSCRKTVWIVEKCLVATETGVPALAGQISESYLPTSTQVSQGRVSFSCAPPSPCGTAG